MVRIAREITRFESAKHIDQIFKSARRIIAQPGIHILISPIAHPFGKILIIAPRAIGTAPVRNKLRRQLRSIFYQEKLFQKGLHCIAILKIGCPNLSFIKLRELLLKAYALQSRISAAS